MKDNTSNINKQRYEAEGHPVEGQQQETRKDKVKRIADKVLGEAAALVGVTAAMNGASMYYTVRKLNEKEVLGLAPKGSERMAKLISGGLIAGGALMTYTGSRTAKRKD